MAYLWWITERVKNKEIGIYDSSVSPDHYVLYRSKRLNPTEFNPVLRVNFDISKERVLKFDNLANNKSIPLVNQRIKSILEEIAPEEVQYFHAKVVCSDGILEDSYYFLNATHAIMCLNHEQSIYTKMIGDDGIFCLSRLVYKKECLKN